MSSLVDRDGAAKILGIPRKLLNVLVHNGLIRLFIRDGGLGRTQDMFRPEAIRQFAARIVDSAKLLSSMPSNGCRLNRLRLRAKTSATEVVRRVLANKIAVLGRLGDKFGDVVVALPEPQAAAGNDRFACARETQKQAPGIGRMDASIIFGSRYEVILALIRAGWLKTVDPRSPRSRIDSDEFEAFCRRYAPTRIYISVVGCTARLVGAMLSRRGVKTIKLTVGRYQVHVVDRKSARKALDLERDPDVVDEAGAEAFTSALGEECRIRTAFKLQSRTNGLTFKTSNGLALKLLINLDGRSVRIGPHYRTRPAIERMEARKSQIVSAYPGPLTWLKREGVLMIEDHLDAPELTDRGQWPVLIERIVSKMEAFKSTFEPSQRVQRMSTRSSSARSRRREDP